MPEKKRFLKNIHVNFISLVDKAANQKQVIYKNNSDQENNITKMIPIAKFDAEKGIVYGIVYSPEQADTDNDFSNAEEIEKMSHEFMKAGKTGNVDTQHTFEQNGCYVVESWITKALDPIFGTEPIGSWAVGIKIENEELKKAIKENEITGLSMAGVAEVEMIEDEVTKTEKKGIIQVIKEAFVNITKDFNSEWKNEQMRQMVWALTDSIRNTLNNDEVSDKKNVIINDIEQFKIAIAGIDISKSNKSNNNGDKQMKPEEIQEIVKTAVTEAVIPLQEKIEKLEKSQPNLEEIEKRLKNVEEATPGSQQVVEEFIKKNAEKSNWLP